MTDIRIMAKGFIILFAISMLAIIFSLPWHINDRCLLSFVMGLLGLLSHTAANSFGIEEAENKQNAIKVVTVIDKEAHRVVITYYDKDDSQYKREEFELDTAFLNKYKKVIAS